MMAIYVNLKDLLKTFFEQVQPDTNYLPLNPYQPQIHSKGLKLPQHEISHTMTVIIMECFSPGGLSIE